MTGIASRREALQGCGRDALSAEGKTSRSPGVFTTLLESFFRECVRETQRRVLYTPQSVPEGGPFGCSEECLTA